MRWERDPPVLALQWLDNKVMSMISTCTKVNDKVQTTRKTKFAGVWDPHRRVDQLQIFHNFTCFMNTIDRSHQIRSWLPIPCTAKACDDGKCFFFFSMELMLLWSTLLSSSKSIKQGSQKMKDFSTRRSSGFKCGTGTKHCQPSQIWTPPLYATLRRPQTPREGFDSRVGSVIF